MRVFLLAVLVAGAMAQDTYKCPDGWDKQEDRDACRCFLLSGSEAVTKADAEVLCASHAGAWVAEIDRPGTLKIRFLKLQEKNFFHRNQLLAERQASDRNRDWRVCSILAWCLH